MERIALQSSGKTSRISRVELTIGLAMLLAASGCVAAAAPAAYVATSEYLSRRLHKQQTEADEAKAARNTTVPETASLPQKPAAPKPDDSSGGETLSGDANAALSHHDEKPSVETRLRELQRIKDAGLITDDLYEQKRIAILNDL